MARELAFAAGGALAGVLVYHQLYGSITNQTSETCEEEEEDEAFMRAQQPPTWGNSLRDYIGECEVDTPTNGETGDDEETGLQRTRSTNQIDSAFDKLDKDHTGWICEEDFVVAVLSLDLDLETPEARRLFEQIDREFGGSAGEINKATFAHAVQRNTLLATLVSEYTSEGSFDVTLAVSAALR